MWAMHNYFGGGMLLYGLIWLVVVAIALTALWRGMRAQEAIARHLETLARTQAQSREPPR